MLGKTQSSLKAQEEYIRSINQGLITAQSFQKSFTHYTLVHALAQSLRTITKIQRVHGFRMRRKPGLSSARSAFPCGKSQVASKSLPESKDLEWALSNVGWLADFKYPKKSQYMKDPGPALPHPFSCECLQHPMNGGRTHIYHSRA